MKYSYKSIHWVHWVIIAFSALLTIFACYFSQKQIHLKVQAQFDRESQQVIYLILDRLTKYEDALWAGVATIHANDDDVNYSFWNAYANQLNLPTKYPGINGIGVIEEVRLGNVNDYLKAQRKTRPNFTIHPKHDKQMHFPISYVFPFKGNEKAFGLDMAHEKNRLSALLKARDTGAAQITGPITLVQDSEKTPGFLFYTPYYKGGAYDTKMKREQFFLGAVYAPFIMTKLMRGLLHESERQVSLEITDNHTVLYSEFNPNNPNYVASSSFQLEKTLPLYGRSWQFRVKGSNSFETAISSSQPLSILIAGIVIDSLLIFLFFSISNANKKAVHLANVMTKDLKDKTVLLEKSNQYKSDFLSNMSHELRTPLNSVILLSQLLKDDLEKGFDEDTLETLEYINKGGHNLLHIVNDILDLAKIESGKMEISITKVELSAIIETIKQEFSISCKEKRLELKLEHDKNLPASICTDLQKLIQIIRNFLSNALKFTERGQIEFSIHAISKSNRTQLASDFGEGIAFSVSDTGIGLSHDQQKEIFDAFIQIDGSLNRQYTGTGLGLNISKNLSRLIGGQILVNSQLGKGAIFTLCLPIKGRSPVLDENKANVHKRAKTYSKTMTADIPQNQELNTLTIMDDRMNIGVFDTVLLLIEDDEIYIKLLLKQAHEKGFKVIVSNYGEDTLFLMKKYQPVALLLDLGLPGIQGAEVITRLRQDDMGKYLPFFIISANTMIDLSKDELPINMLQNAFSKNQLTDAFNKIESQLFLNKSFRILYVTDHKTVDLPLKGKFWTMDCSCTTLDLEEKIKKGYYHYVVVNDYSAQKEVLTQISQSIQPNSNITFLFCGNGPIPKKDYAFFTDFSDRLLVSMVYSEQTIIMEISRVLERMHRIKQYENDRALAKLYFYGKKALIVDDNEQNIFVLEKILASNGMSFISVQSGSEALALLKNEKDFNIILMDIMMPGMNGYETIGEIRKNNALKSMPIIAVTAKVMRKDRTECLKAGANDYIMKPIDDAKLIMAMIRHL